MTKSLVVQHVPPYLYVMNNLLEGVVNLVSNIKAYTLIVIKTL